MSGEAGKCAICSTPCTKFCSKCKKSYYCSVEHQKSDRKSHKKICFPAKLETDEVQGRFFVSTRNISPGDEIFSEKALVVGPSGAEKYFHKICLGCYRVVRSDYVCSKCKWPVCSAECEKLPPHSETECQVFAGKGVRPYFTKAYEYDFIKFLRTLLLRDQPSADGKWEQVTQLASHKEARDACEASVLATMASYEFITQTCGLNQFDYDTVSHVVGVWGVNSFGANAPSGPNPTGRLASFLFPKTSLCSHSCVANTRGILLEEEVVVNGSVESKRPLYTMKLLASQLISEGRPILITYAEVGEGTWERQRVLRDNYYFSCTCERCRDPTEFGTNFSAFKCPQCESGYLLPVDPLDADSAWNCFRGESKGCRPGRKYYDLSGPLMMIKYQMNAIGMNDTKQEIKEFERILAEHSGKTLHPNHWLLMEVKYRLIQRLICFMPEAKNINAIIRNCVAHSQHCLDVANVIRPGHNPYRGKILYCLCQGKLQEIVRDAGGDVIEKRASLSKLKEKAQEAMEILSKEPIGSDERTLGESLKEDLTQIQRIIAVLDSKIKHSI